MKLRSIFAGIVVAVIGTFLFLVFRGTEPVVNGQPVSYWIEPSRYEPGETFISVETAFREMDERSVRWLASELEWKPARFRDASARVVNRVLDGAMPNATPGDRRVLVALFLGNLGERAMSAVPALKKAAQTTVEPEAWSVRAAAKATLIRLGQEPLQAHVDALRDTSDRGKWFEAIGTLDWIGTNAAPAVPAAVAIVASTNDVWVRNRAAGFLGAVGVNAELCVPVLMHALKEPEIRGAALNSLGQFGLAASNATDAVILCLTDTHRSVQLQAARTLQAINPEKAASLTNSSAQ